MAGFFGQFAQSWANPEGPMMFLHRMQGARMSFIRGAIGAKKNLECLDLGAGIGMVSAELAKMGHSVDSVECERELIEKSQELHSEFSGAMEWICADAASFEPKKSYDVIVCLEMLEHVDNPEELCCKMVSWLNPGGHLVLSTLNRTNAAYFTAILGAEYILGLLPRGTHDFEKFLTPAELNHYTEPLICQKIQGLIYNPLEKNFFLGRCLSINYIGHWKKD